jgi:hypothetical protein
MPKKKQHDNLLNNKKVVYGAILYALKLSFTHTHENKTIISTTMEHILLEFGIKRSGSSRHKTSSSSRCRPTIQQSILGVLFLVVSAVRVFVVIIIVFIVIGVVRNKPRCCFCGGSLPEESFVRVSAGSANDGGEVCRFERGATDEEAVHIRFSV